MKWLRILSALLIALTIAACSYQSFDKDGKSRQFSFTLLQKEQTTGPQGATLGTDGSGWVAFHKDLGGNVLGAWNSPTTQMGMQLGAQAAFAYMGQQFNAEVADLRAEVERLKAENEALKASATPLPIYDPTNGTSLGRIP